VAVVLNEGQSTFKHTVVGSYISASYGGVHQKLLLARFDKYECYDRVSGEISWNGAYRWPRSVDTMRAMVPGQQWL
jgi:hypothetical protein